MTFFFLTAIGQTEARDVVDRSFIIAILFVIVESVTFVYKSQRTIPSLLLLS